MSYFNEEYPFYDDDITFLLELISGREIQVIFLLFLTYLPNLFLKVVNLISNLRVQFAIAY